MTQELQQDAERLYEAVRRLVQIYQFRDKERICCHNVTMTEWSALEHLVEAGPMKLADLAELLMLDKSTVSRVVDTLVRKDLAGRVENPQDRRAVCLAAKDKGTALYDKIRKSLLAEEARLISDLPLDGRRAAIEVIQRLSQAARKRAAHNSNDSVPDGLTAEQS